MKLVWQKWLDSLDEDTQFLSVTPIGLIPSDFKIWIGHTDFPLTAQILPRLVVSGVEGLSVHSPYRFRICIGELFDDREVKLNIQRNLGITTQDDPKIQAYIDQAKTYINKPVWAIYVLPNGKIDYVQGDNLDEIWSKYDLYEKSKDMVGGFIAKSW